MTNLSDCISLSREALWRALVCLRGWCWGCAKHCGLQLAPVCLVNSRGRSQWYFQPVLLPEWTLSLSAELCVAGGVIIVTLWQSSEWYRYKEAETCSRLVRRNQSDKQAEETDFKWQFCRSLSKNQWLISQMLIKTNRPHLLLFLMMFMCRWRIVCKNLTLSPCVIRLRGKWITVSWPQCVIVSQRWRITTIVGHFLKFPTEANNQHKAYLHAWGHICILNSACCRHVCKSTIVIVPTINFLNYFPEAIKKKT